MAKPIQPDHEGKHPKVAYTEIGMHFPAPQRALDRSNPERIEYGSGKEPSPARPGPGVQAHTVPGNLARDGAAKLHSNVPIHANMKEQVTEAGRTLRGHPSGALRDYPDASSGSPLDPTAPRNNIKAPSITPGMKSHTMAGWTEFTDCQHKAQGAKVLQEAINAGDPNHPGRR